MDCIQKTTEGAYEDKKITVGVVIPIYNIGRELLSKCIDSVLLQTWSDIEIILVDDGSTDEDGAVCDDYAANHINIKVVHQCNQGLSGARNVGIRCSTAECIYFLDADDRLTSKRSIEVLCILYKHFDADVVYGAYHFSNIKPNLLKDLNGIKGSGLLDFLICNNGGFAACDQLMSRRVLVNNRLEFCLGLIHEDEEFVPRFLMNCKRVAVSTKLTYTRCFRDESITQSKDEESTFKRILGKFMVSQSLYEYFKDTELSDVMIQRANNFINAALKLWSCNTQNKSYHSILVTKYKELRFFEKSACDFRSKQNFRTFLGSRFIKIFGLQNYLKVLRIIFKNL